MSFGNRLNLAGLTSSARALLPSNVVQARKLWSSFAAFDAVFIESCFEKSSDAALVRRGAEAFAIWLAACRFVVQCHPGRNARGCSICQTEASLLLTAQLCDMDQTHPAFEGIDVLDFAQSVRDAFQAHALDLELSVDNAASEMVASGYIDDCSSPFGGIFTQSSLQARAEILMGKRFLRGLWKRCHAVARPDYWSGPNLFGRITVREGKWHSLIGKIDSPLPKVRTPRQSGPMVYPKMFADL